VRPRHPRITWLPVLFVTLAACSMFSDDRSPLLFREGFEEGNLARAASVDGLVVQQAVANSGRWAARSTGSGTAANAAISIGSYSEVYVRMRFFLVDRSTNVWVFSLRTGSGGPIALLGVSSSGKLLMRNGSSGVTRTSAKVVTDSVWHELLLHARIGSSGRSDVWYDGAPVAMFSRAEDLGDSPFELLLLGETVAGRTYDVAIDDVSVSTDRDVGATEPPGIPEGLTGHGVDSSQVDLAWRSSTDDDGVTGYAAYRSTDGAHYEQVGRSSTPNLRVSGLAPETRYWFTVDAVGATGARSERSDPVEVATEPRGPTPPSVVVVMSDDQPADTISRMPILQSELVGKGVSFPNGVVTNPLCCPSRASIQRGQYSHTTGVYGNDPPFGGYAMFIEGGLHNATIATWLDGHGFRTGFIGKYMNGAGAHERPPGWDFWRGATPGYYGYKVNEDGVIRTYGSAPADYSTSVYASYADAFIRSTSADSPLLLMVNPYAPHTPYTPEPRYAQDAGCADETNTSDPAFNEADVSDKPAYIRTKHLVSAQSIGVDRRRAQCRMMLSVDDLIGTVLDGLSDTGRLGNTLFVFLSDNGSADGEHRWNYKSVPYEGSLRVPFIVRFDPLTNGQARIDYHLVANVDLAPTLLDLLDIGATPGCPSPPYGGSCSGGFDGRSFLAELDGSPTPAREPLLLEQYDSGGAVPPYCGIRTATHKFVRYSTGDEEMYDLVADPNELSNMLRDGSMTTSDHALRDGFMSQLFGVGGMCSPPPPSYALP
jgi:N-acetylglucosamine-6-sulfatase